MARALAEDYEMDDEEQAESSKWQYQYSIDYFDSFYNGENYGKTKDRQLIFERFPIPYWAPPREDPAFGWQFSEDYQPWLPQRRFAEHKRNDDGTGYTVDRGLEQRLNGMGLTFKRILGAGSQGLAVQFQYLDGQNFVFKWGTDLESQVVEMLILKDMVGARHVVQVSLHLVSRPTWPVNSCLR